MLKAVLLEQWHSLSDPELEHSLITRIDYSTLCRYRNWLAQDDTLSELLELINRQLTEKGLKIEKASAAVIDATIIPMSATTCRLCWKALPKVRPSMPIKAMTVRKTGNI